MAEPALQKQSALKNLALIKQTPIEQFLQRAAQVKEELEREKKRALKPIEIMASIFSVYHFIQVRLDAPRMALSLKDFEICEKELREIMEKEVKSQRFRFSWKTNPKKYFLENGYFPKDAIIDGEKVYCSCFLPEFTKEEFKIWFNNLNITDVRDAHHKYANASSGSNEESAAERLADCLSHFSEDAHNGKFLPYNLEKLFKQLLKKHGIKI